MIQECFIHLCYSLEQPVFYEPEKRYFYLDAFKNHIHIKWVSALKQLHIFFQTRYEKRMCEMPQSNFAFLFPNYILLCWIEICIKMCCIVHCSLELGRIECCTVFKFRIIGICSLISTTHYLLCGYKQQICKFLQKYS